MLLETASRSRWARLLLLTACWVGAAAGATSQGTARRYPPSVTAFAALGNSGDGSVIQGSVAAGLAACPRLDVVLLLGGNILPEGVTSVSDTQFSTKFALPFALVDGPFRPTLGSADLGLQGTDFFRGDYQVGYSALDPKWQMPARHYAFFTDEVMFVSLETPKIFFNDTAAQRADLALWLAQAGTRWKVAFGSHPYRSNGSHGNAGSYDGVPVPPINGIHVKSFLEQEILGKFDVYLSAWDASLQDHGEIMGTSLLVSGAGSGSHALPGSNPTLFQASTPGFVRCLAIERALLIEFRDANGTVLHQRLRRRP